MKKLGQHFLKNKKKIKKIIKALDLKKGETVIEIGAGHGELTQPLIEKSKKDDLLLKIIAIEKDPRLFKNLKDLFKDEIEILEGDVLKIFPELVEKLKKEEKENLKILGNLPFYLTGRILRIIGEIILKNQKLIKRIVFTLQKEVAERIIAQPPKMNLLAASVQFWAEPKIIDFISKKDFSPKPKVDAAIILLKPKDFESKIAQKYYQLIKILFKQPRKTILNNLSQGLNQKKQKLLEKFLDQKFNLNERPQNLNLQKIKKLIQILYNKKK